MLADTEEAFNKLIDAKFKREEATRMAEEERMANERKTENTRRTVELGYEKKDLEALL